MWSWRRRPSRGEWLLLTLACCYHLTVRGAGARSAPPTDGTDYTGTGPPKNRDRRQHHEQNATCEPLILPACQTLNLYSDVRLPNAFGHSTQHEVSRAFTRFAPMLKTPGCGEWLGVLLCLTYVPPCRPARRPGAAGRHRGGVTAPACRQLCASAWAGCWSAMDRAGMHWPHALDCEVMPIGTEEDGRECVMRKGKLINDTSIPPTDVLKLPTKQPLPAKVSENIKAATLNLNVTNTPSTPKVTSLMKKLTPPSMKLTSRPKKLITQPKRPSSPLKKLTSPLKKPPSPHKKLASPLKKPSAPPKKPKLPLKKSTSPLRKSTSPLKKPNSPLKKPALPRVKLTSPLKKPAAPTKKATPAPNKNVKSSKPKKIPSNKASEEKPEVKIANTKSNISAAAQTHAHAHSTNTSHRLVERSPAVRMKPRRYDIFEIGDSHQFHGWADVQGQGAANDYCRVIGRAPRQRFLSCALAGGTGQDHVYVSKRGFDVGQRGSWFMRDMDKDGRDDFCRCIGRGVTSKISCMKAGKNGFYGSLPQPGNQYTFYVKAKASCYGRTVNPILGVGIND